MPNQLRLGVLGNKGNVTRLVPLRKCLGRSVAMKLPDALGLAVHCDKLVDESRARAETTAVFRRLNLAIDDRTHDGEWLSFTRGMATPNENKMSRRERGALGCELKG